MPQTETTAGRATGDAHGTKSAAAGDVMTHEETQITAGGVILGALAASSVFKGLAGTMDMSIARCFTSINVRGSLRDYSKVARFSYSTLSHCLSGVPSHRWPPDDSP